MKLLTTVRRRFSTTVEEKSAANLLANLFGSQILALLTRGFEPSEISEAIRNNPILKGYVIGVAWHIDKICKVGDLEFVIRTCSTVLDLGLNHRGVEKVDFLSTLVQTFNVDRKNPSAEWTQGIAFATDDVKSYGKAIQASMEEKIARGAKVTWKDAPMPDDSMVTSLALFKVVLKSLDRQRLAS